jgi:hypothetical protein
MSAELSDFSDEERLAAHQLLGESMPPLSTFSTEDYLQRVQVESMSNLGSLALQQSRVPGGSLILAEQRNLFESQLISVGAEDAFLRASALSGYFSVGFGLVERTSLLADGYYPQGTDSAEVAQSYRQWRVQPMPDRTKEMRDYLTRRDAGLLADNLLSPEGPGYMLSNILGTISISISRVNGQDPFEVRGRHPDAPPAMQEGVLAGLFVLREEYTAGDMKAVGLEDLRDLEESAPQDLPQAQAVRPRLLGNVVARLTRGVRRKRL